MLNNMEQKNLRKIAMGILLIWGFFASYTFAESIGAVYDSHENNTKACESAIYFIDRKSVV